MVVSQLPSRASNRPYTPIFEGRGDGGNRQAFEERRGRYEQEQDEEDGDEYGEQFGGPEGLQFLW